MDVYSQLSNGKFIRGSVWIESDEHRVESLVQLVGILEMIHKVNPMDLIAVHYKEVHRSGMPPETSVVQKTVCQKELAEAQRRYVVQKIDRCTESWNSDEPCDSEGALDRRDSEDPWDSEPEFDPADI